MQPYLVVNFIIALKASSHPQLVSSQNEGLPASDSFSLRASVSADSEFLALLYLSTRSAELSYLGEPLLLIQYEIRRKGYLASFSGNKPGHHNGCW